MSDEQERTRFELVEGGEGDANEKESGRVPSVLEELERVRFAISMAEERMFSTSDSGIFQMSAEEMLRVHLFIDHLDERVRTLLSVTHNRLDELKACPKHNEQREIREITRLQFEAMKQGGGMGGGGGMMPPGFGGGGGGDDEPSN